MQPIFMSPNFEQADRVKNILDRHEIDASIIEKASSSQIDTEEPIKWYELWLRKHSNAERANTIITQYEFDTLRNNLNNKSRPVSYEKTQPIVIAPAYEEPAKVVKTTKFHNVLKSRTITSESQLPVNNKAVFQRLASALGTKQSSEAHYNKVLRPWNSKSLVDRVKNLRHLTK